MNTQNKTSGVTPGARLVRLPLSLLPMIGLVALPKCPMCLAAYAGVLGSFGLLPWLQMTWSPLLALLALAALIPLAYRWIRHRKAGPLLVGFLGVAALLAARWVTQAAFLLYPGVALLLGASLWNAWPARLGFSLRATTPARVFKPR